MERGRYRKRVREDSGWERKAARGNERERAGDKVGKRGKEEERDLREGERVKESRRKGRGETEREKDG